MVPAEPTAMSKHLGLTETQATREAFLRFDAGAVQAVPLGPMMQGMVRRAAMADLQASRHWQPVVRTRCADPTARTGRGAARHPRRPMPRHDVRTAAWVRRHTDRRADVSATACPVQQYETLRPYIERQRLHRRSCVNGGGAAVLRADERNNWDTEIRSDHPDLSRDAPRRSGALLISSIQGVPDSVSRHGHGRHGCRREGHLDSGHAVGSVSGHLYASMPRLIQSRFVVPPTVSAVANYDLKSRSFCTSRSRNRISPTSDRQTHQHSSACLTC